MVRRLPRALAVIVLALPSLALADGLERVVGKALFDRVWVQAPSSTAADDGLGPLFNEKSCAACHSGPSLSARIEAGDNGALTARGLVVHLGDRNGRLDPVYGRQIQSRSISNMMSEGSVDFSSGDRPSAPVRVRFQPLRGPLAAGTSLGPRQAPSLRGIGRLEQVDGASVEALAVSQQKDGLNGRPRWLTVNGRRVLGLYGWKASAATLDQQIADAFMLDIGLSSPLAPHPAGDCTAAETDCLAAPDGRSPGFDNEEVSTQMIGLVRAYLEALRPSEPTPSTTGTALFASTGCAACHVPALPAKGGGTVTVFTDLLLHDMGPALDDGVGEPGVASSQWRTAPLIGLAYRQASERRYLHDGRAANLDEAIRAHDGDAARAAGRYNALQAADKAALLAYLETL